MMMVVYLHLGAFAHSVIKELDRKIEEERVSQSGTAGVLRTA
jgi:hypothetical protein